MANRLFGNYSNPGKGITKKSENEKSRFAHYFELIIRKFWDICTLNLLLDAFFVPFLGISYLIMTLMRNTSIYTNDLQLLLVIIFSPFMFFGPFLGAANRIARDFAREEPIFIWGDFFKTLKKNYKQTLVLSILGYIGTAALSFAIPAYYSVEGAMRYVLFPLCMLAALIFVFMQYYVYTMAVSFDLKIREIIKNAFIFSFACVFKNLLITLIFIISAVICVLLFILGLNITVFFGLIIILLAGFLIAFLLYSVNYIIFPSLKKYIIDPYYSEHTEMTSAVLNDKSSDSDGESDKEIPEYVYHNGRMVHRSVLEAESLFEDDLSDNSEKKNNKNNNG